MKPDYKNNPKKTRAASLLAKRRKIMLRRAEKSLEMLRIRRLTQTESPIPQTSTSLSKQIDGDHYKQMGIQPWEIIEKNNLDYFEGSALGYLLRWRKKDGIIDLDKAIHCIERIKELFLSGHYGDGTIPGMPHNTPNCLNIKRS